MKYLIILFSIFICGILGIDTNNQCTGKDKSGKEKITEVDSLVINCNFLYKAKYILTPDSIVYELDGIRKDVTEKYGEDSLYQSGLNLFVTESHIPILAKYVQERGITRCSLRYPEVNVEIWRNNKREYKIIRIMEWEDFTRRVYSKSFKKLVNTMLRIVYEDDSINLQNKQKSLFQDAREDYKIEKYKTSNCSNFEDLSIRYFYDLPNNSCYSVYMRNDEMDISKWNLCSDNPKDMILEYILTLPKDDKFHALAIMLFYKKYDAIVKGKSDTTVFNKHPKELLDVINNDRFGFAGVIDRHVEDQIIEYSPEFNEFMARLKKLIAKAEKEAGAAKGKKKGTTK